MNNHRLILAFCFLASNIPASVCFANSDKTGAPGSVVASFKLID